MKKLSLSIVFLVSIWLSVLQAQTTGMILEPATGGSEAILDPNDDGFISTTTAGFLGNDKLNSELAYKTLIPAGSEPSSDVRNGPNCGFTDFVETVAGGIDPIFHYSDGTHWFFRFRMADIKPNAKSYSILIDTDGLFGPADVGTYSASNPGFEIEIVLATKFAVKIYDLDQACGSNVVATYPISRSQKSLAASSVCTQFNYFLDFYVDWADLASFGIDENSQMRYAIVDNMAADKSTICNPNSASDIGGVDDNSCGSFENCFTTVIEAQPPCAPSSVIPCVYSDCPVISGQPISTGATSISGLSTEADGSTIRVYVNGLLAGSSTVIAGAWTVSPITALVANDQVTATAQATDEVESGTNCNNLAVAGVSCTAPLDALLVGTNSANKGFEGDVGSAIPGANIVVYDINGVALDPPVDGTIYSAGTITVDVDGSWIWKCTTGGPCLPDGVYALTQQVAGECESTPIYICVELATSATTPVITTSPLTTATTSISGTMPAPDDVATDVTVIVYANNVQIGSATTTAGGAWTVAGLTLNACDDITVAAVRGGATPKCMSPTTAIVTVGDVTIAPVITGTYCGTTSTVTGTSTGQNGTVINIFDNGALCGTTTVNGGVWSATAAPAIIATHTITATAQDIVLCQSTSLPSAGELVGASYAGVATITPDPVIENDVVISGTGVAGDIVSILIDDWQMYLDFAETTAATAIVDGTGNWTMNLIDVGIFYAGGTLTIKSSNGGACTSAAQDPTPIICVMPLNNLVVNPDNTAVCADNIVANIEVEASESGVIYQLYDNNLAANTGSSVLGNGLNVFMNTSVLTANSNISVQAIKFPFGTCTGNLTESVNVIVNNNPDLTLAIVEDANDICAGTSVNITVALSVVGFNYQLRDDSDNSDIGSPVAGTGGTINLPTGNVIVTTTFNVTATSTLAPTFCSGEMDDLVTITVLPAPTLAAVGTDPATCGANGSIVLNFTNVADGVYTIDYDLGSFAAVAIAAGTGTITAPAGIYDNLSITAAGCTSIEDVDIVLSDPPTPTLSATGTDPITCGGNGSIDFTVSNVADGTYTIDYDAGSFSGVVVTGGIASVTAVAGTYNNLSITIGSCTSAEDVDIVLSDPPTPTLAATGTDPASCGGNGSIDFTFSNVADGTYSIDYDAGSFSGVVVTGGLASVTAIAGTYNNLSITTTGCTSIENVDIVIDIACSDLVTVKTLSSGDATPTEGDIVSFEILVSNLGDDQATNVSLIDVLPVGLSPTLNNGNLSQGSYNSGTGLWNVGTLDNGNSATLTLEGTVDVGEAGNTITNNTTKAIGDQTDPTDASNDLTESIVVNTLALDADLVTEKTLISGDATPLEGGLVTFLISVFNSGPDQATNISLNDVLPVGLSPTLNNGNLSQGSYNSGTGLWNVGTLDNGNSATLTLEGTVDVGEAGNTITNNTTKAIGDQTDPTDASNDLTESIVVNTLALDADLVTEKTLISGDATPLEGGLVTFLISVFNSGPDQATNISLNDVLPVGLSPTLNNGNLSQGSYNSGTGLWNVGTLDNGNSATLTLEGTVDVGEAGNTITNNTTKALGDQTDPTDLGNDLSEFVDVECTLSASAAVTTAITCNAGTGTVTITASGGTAPISYTFDGVNSATGVFAGIVAGVNYNWSVTDANSCGPESGTLTVTEPTAITASAAITTAITCNSGTGEVTITASGGTAPLSYTFDGATNATGIFTGISAGVNYAWSVTDANSCGPESGTLTVTEPTAITASAAITTAITCNAGTGTVTLTASGGTAPLSYTFDGATNATGIFTGISAGVNYAWSVTDANSCGPESGTLTVTEPTAITASAAITTAITCNAGTGTVTLTASGGTGALSYTFDGATNATGIFTGILAGVNYAWSVTDANSCGPESGTLTVTEPTAISASAAITTAITCNAGTGEVTITASGGTAPLSYTFDGATNATGIFTGISAGVNYAWSVTDANSCGPESGTLTVTEPTAISASAAITTAITCNAGTGTVTLTASGGTAPLSYTFDGATNATGIFTGISAGVNYAWSVTDANSCGPESGTLTVTEPTAISASAAITTAITCNAGTGTVTITASGGTAPLSYTFDGTTNATGIFTGISAGVNYAWSVTDASACDPETGTLTVTEPTAISASAAVTTAITCNAGTGEVTITASGGTAPLSYTFDGATNATGIFTGILAGINYAWSVTDANSCGPESGTLTVTEPTAISASAAITTAITCNAGTGTVTLTASGGTAPLSYTFDGATNATGIFTGILAGVNYAWSVTDANSCGPESGTLTVTEPTAITASAAITTAITCNAGTGTVTLTASGGTAPLSYTFDGATNATGIFTGILAGVNYAWSVTDANSCGPESGTLTVTEPTAITASAAITTAITCNAGTGTVTLTASGGTAPLSYTFDGATNATGIFTGILAGVNYAWSVTDANSCGPESGTLTVTEPTAITASAAITTAITCNAGTGEVTITASGGTAPLSYTFDGATNATGIFTGILAGVNYAWSVTDANSCGPESGTLTVTEPTAITASAAITTAITCNAGTGEVTITASGGTAPLSYTFDGATNATGIFTGILAGVNYAWSVTDANSCGPESGTLTVTEPTAISASAAITTAITCNAGTGTVTLTASGGTGALSYTFDGATNATGIFTGILAGVNYAWSVTDASACGPETGTLTVTEPTAISASVTSTNPTSCNGIDGSITITASGGSGAFEYSIDGGTIWQASNIFNGLSADIYQIRVRNIDSSCEVSESDVILSDPATHSISAIGTNPLSCGANGSIAFTFTNVADGTYTIDYDAGSFSGVVVTGGIASVTAVAGTYNNLSITIGSCTSAEDVDIVLSDPLMPTLAATGTDPASCGGNGSIDFTFSNVADGTYTIDYDAGSFAGVIVTGGSASVTAVEGTYNNLSITTTGCTSIENVDIVIDKACSDLVTVKTLSSGDATPTEGDIVSFEILVSNLGDDQATNVSLIDLLPAGLSATAATVSQGSYDAGTGIWLIGTIDNGNNASLTLEGTVDVGQAGNTITNITSAASGDQEDPTDIDNDLEESVTVNSVPIANDDISAGNVPGVNTVIDILGNDLLGDGTLASPTFVSIDLDPLTAGDQNVLIVVGEGTWTYNPVTGELTFDPEAGFTTDPTALEYTLTETGTGLTDTATVTVDYNEVPPVANDDISAGNVPGVNTVIDILDNDLLGDGTLATSLLVSVDLDPLTAGDQNTLVVAGEGTWTYNPVTGELTFDPEAGFTTDPTALEYTLTETGTGLTDTATVTITYDEVAPVANDDISAGNVPGVNTVIDILGNDLLGDGTLATSLLVSIDLDPLTAGDQNTLVVAGEGTWTYNPVTGELTFDPEAGFTADPTALEYTLTEIGTGLTDTATVTITYDEVAPVANDDISAGNVPGVNTVIDILGNDLLGDGTLATSLLVSIDLDPLTAGDQNTLVVAGEGTWTYNPVTGELTFDPEAGFTADPTALEYTLTEIGTGLTDTATVTIAYDEVAPVANDDISAGNVPGVNTVIDILGNDLLGDGTLATSLLVSIDLDPLTAGDQNTLVVAGEGTWTYNPVTGELTFDPEAGFTADPTALEYTLNETGTGLTDTATVTIAYDEVAPVANDDISAGNVPGVNTVIDILGNDLLGDGTLATSLLVSIDLDPLTAGDQNVLIVVGEGTWTYNPITGELTFDPEAGFTTDPTALEYTLTELATGLSNTAIVTITYDEIPPIANDNVSNGNVPGENAVINIINVDLLGDGTSANPALVSVDLDPSTPGDQNILVVTGEGTWTYNSATGELAFDPEDGFSTDPTPLEYKLTESGTGLSDTAIVTISYDEVPPIANDDSSTGHVPGVNAVINIIDVDLLGDGTSANPALVSVDLDPSTDGDQNELIVAGEGTWTYNPATGELTFDPEDGFTTDPTPIEYKLTESGTGLSDTAIVTISYDEVPPIANDDVSSGNFAGVNVVLNILGNDLLGDGTSANPSLVSIDLDPSTPGDQNILVVAGEGTWTYNPATGELTFNPETGFTANPTPISYTLTETATGLSDTALITISYILSDPPETVPDYDTTYSNLPVTVEILLNDTYSDLANLTISICGNAANGTIEINDDGTITYQPDFDFVGSDLFCYEICDSGLSNQCATTTVYIEVISKDNPIDVLHIFNALTPDGDGANDTWVIRNIYLYPNNEVIIFNRWGDIVREIKNYDNVTNFWDGTNRHGEYLPDGTYYYLLWIKINGKEVKFDGWLYIHNSRN